MYIRPQAITGELRKVPKVHILPNWLCRCPRLGSTTDRMFAHPVPLSLPRPSDRDHPAAGSPQPARPWTL